MLLLNRPGDSPVGLQQRTAILQDARSDWPSLPRLGGDDLRSRESFSVLLEAFDTEELGTDGLFQIGKDASGWPGRIHCVFRTTAKFQLLTLQDKAAVTGNRHT